MGPETAEALSGAASAALGVPTRVELTDAASVGATRRTFFGHLHTAEASEPVVVQLAGMQLDGLPLPVEAEVVRRARAAGVPAPEPILASDDDRVVGAPFQIVRRVEGLTVPRHVLRAVEADPDLGGALAADCGAALARLHALAPDELPARVPDLATPTPAAAYRGHLRRIAAALPPSPVVSLGRRWLARHEPPAPPRPALVHSDFRNGNLIVEPDRDHPRWGLAAAIDWELAHLGDPMEDLAWLCLRCWRFGADRAEVGGFGHIDDLVAAYEAAGGTFRADAFGWWQVARTLWWALVLTMQATAFRDGASDSLVLAASGRRVAEIEHDLLVLIDPDGEPQPRR